MLQYHTTVDRLVGNDGETYFVTKAMFPPGRKPRGGWAVAIQINRQEMKINGMNPQDVANKVRHLLTLNELNVSTLDLWLNLNIQWATNAVEKYQKIFLADLIAITQ